MLFCSASTHEHSEQGGGRNYSRWSSFHDSPGANRKCTIEERLTYTQNMCRTWYERNPVSEAPYRNIFVDHKHKLLLCVPYKSGASTHLNLLAQNSDAVLNNEIPKEELDQILQSLSKKTSQKRVGIDNLNKIKSIERSKILEEYYKVMVVRHPFVRILSMYSNKVAQYNQDTHLWDCSDNHYGTGLTNWMQKKHPNRVGNCSLDMFVSYLLNNSKMFRLDMHTHLMHSWCNPCDISYDFIVRLETGDSDQEYLLKNKINPNFNRILHENQVLSRNVTSTDMFTRNLSQFRGVSDAQLEGLTQFYGEDLAMFGYEYDWFTHDTFLI